MMEQDMIRHLSWKTYPVTIFTYLSWMLSQWDTFLLAKFATLPYNRLDLIMELPLEHLEIELARWNSRFILFKHPNEAAYTRYVEIMQIMDSANLSIDTYSLPRSQTAVGLLYLMVGLHFSTTNHELLRYSLQGDTDYYNFMTNFGSEQQRVHEIGPDYYANEVAELLHTFITSVLGLDDI
jgi:hypothetical protein